MQIDLNYIHDILVDAKDDPRYSDEAREHAKAFADMLHAVYVTGWRHGQANPDTQPD